MDDPFAFFIVRMARSDIILLTICELLAITEEARRTHATGFF
jgi:hypothetical protein